MLRKYKKSASERKKKGTQLVGMKVKVKSLSCVRLFATPWFLPGSSIHGIFQARYWSGLPFPSPEDLPNPEIEPGSPALQADALPFEPPGKIPDGIVSQFYDNDLMALSRERAGPVLSPSQASPPRLTQLLSLRWGLQFLLYRCGN